MNKIVFGDCRETLRGFKDEGAKVQTCVTSPPYYGLRDYGHAGQLGLEQTPEDYIRNMVEVFRCVRNVLADDGTLWVNIGDSYAGSGKGDNPNGKQGTNTGTRFKSPTSGYVPDGLKPKDMIGIPWMLAFALRADGWYLRQDIIWAKPNPMPESVTDRCTKSHEHIFLLSKSGRYYFDNTAIKEPTVTQENRPNEVKRDRVYGYDSKQAVIQNRTIDKTRGKPPGQQEQASVLRNKRDVWTVATKPYKGAHFATFPEELIIPCILSGSRVGDVVLDPFMGSGTTAAVAVKVERKYLGCELNEDYRILQKARIDKAFGYDDLI